MTEPESYLGKMFSKTETKTPDEIADYLEHDNEVRSLAFPHIALFCAVAILTIPLSRCLIDGCITQLEETHSSAADAGQSEVRCGLLLLLLTRKSD